MMSTSFRRRNSAPSYDVPQERIVSIEHPCIVKNFDNGFKSLGGEQQLKHAIEHEVQSGKASRSTHVEPVAGVSLRPNDPFAKKLSSTAIPSQNVLVKVTVPKRTGRKRKRGSDGAFEGPPSGDVSNPSITAKDLLQRLRDNEGNYAIQPVGILKDTHRFQGLPDFQTRSEDVPIMRELRDHAMQPDYDRLKAFSINFNPELNAPAAFPGPPSFLRSAGLAGRRDDIEPARQASKPAKAQPSTQRRKSQSGSWWYWEQATSLDNEQLPQAPPAELPLQPQDGIQKAIDALKAAFKERPIISVRAFGCMYQGHTTYSLRAAVPHVGFYMHTGPWAHTIAKYGVDPRKDPEMRKYQTITISCKRMSTAKIPAERRVPEAKAHIFDGVLIGAVSNCWQLCDLIDPTLEDIINTPNIRSECELEDWGWYYNGTIQKLRTITREKMVRVVNSEVQLPEEDYRLLAALPDNLKEIMELATDTFPMHGEKSYLRGLAQQIVTSAVYRVRGTEPDGGAGKQEPSNLDGVDEDEEIDGAEYQQAGDEEDAGYMGG